MDSENIRSEISALLDKWENRRQYLHELIAVEQKYYPLNTKEMDAMYCREAELAGRSMELQGLLNKIDIQ